MVREVREARPNGCDAILKETGGLDAENRSPHSSHESAKADGRIGTPHAIDRPDDDGICNAVLSTHLAGERNDDAANGEAKEDNGDGFASGKTKRHDRGDGTGKWWGKHV